MLSYLVNRHYHLLTKELPDQLRTDQPQVVYLPSHNCEKVNYKDFTKPQHKLKLRKSKQLFQTNPNIGDCCPICFSSQNIAVQFYSKQHVCVKCRKLMRDEFGNQIRIFVNEVGEIVCLGIKASKKQQETSTKKYYYTDYTQLNINGKSAFATFAKPDQMVLILRMPSQSVQ